MDILQNDLKKLQKDANLQHSIDDVDKIIELLERAREQIVENPNTTAFTLTKLSNPLKSGFDKVNDDLKKVHRGHSGFGKSLDKNFPAKALPTVHDPMSSHPTLINRAIAMHLLREGQFQVAQTFLDEALENPTSNESADLTSLKSRDLQDKFANMYQILHELRQSNLHPAIMWARQNSVELENRGSNLEFELCKLQYLWLFQGPQVNGLPDDSNNGWQGAFKYGRQNFPRHAKFQKETQQLVTAIAFRSNIQASPYARLFDTSSAWADVSNSFTREFCSLLGLSPTSPLYQACTAGAIALPTLLKLASIVKEKHTEWTTQHELPVEIPLPKSMIYHAIFVCPVSKEQTTEENPPMMMPCGHVVAKESLQKISKGGRFKCPYCPNESLMREAKQVVL